MPEFFVHADIARARTIDKNFYLSEDCFRSSKEKIFAPSWQFITDTDSVKQPGSVYPFTLLENYLDEPLLLTRDLSENLYCVSNVCTHRGNLLVQQPCHLKHLKCRYHGRIFDLDGRFVSMPEFREVLDFPSPADNLHRLPVFSWGKLLFTSLQPLYQFHDFFGNMMQRMAWFPVDKMTFSSERSMDFTVKANWALYCENYLEGFHIPFVHGGLNAVLDFGAYTTEIFPFSNLQLGIGKKGAACFDLPSSSPDFGKEVAAYYFWIFPNLMFNFYPWGLSVNIVQPRDIAETQVSFLTYVLDETRLDTGAGSGLDTVELEDEEVVENVQKGIRSRFYQHGRYSVTREIGTHHFHSLLVDFMK